MGKEIFTIGYEGASQGAVLAALAYNDILTLVDIRELPQSRKPLLSKKGLAAAAAQFGIRYIHLRALGTPRDIRYQRKIDHDQVAFEAKYRDYLSTQGEVMEVLLVLVKESRVCLLCYEAIPNVCHRMIVAERAVVMSGGTLTPVHLSPQFEITQYSSTDTPPPAR